MLWMGTELLLLFIFPLNSAQISQLPAVMDSDMLTEFAYQSGPSYLSLVLLVLAVGLSGSVYLCVLQYICTGCCQPVVGPEDESMSGMDAPWGSDQLPRATAGSSCHGNNCICLPLDGAGTSAGQIA